MDEPLPTMNIRASLLFCLAFLPLVHLSAAPPVFTSASTASGQKGEAFTFELTVDQPGPILFGASGLPPGVIRNGSTLIGIPSEVGTFLVTLYATNQAEETGTGVLQVEITSQPPEINSLGPVEGRVGSPLNFDITSTNSPTSYSAIGLSAIGGLTLNASTGRISGVPVNSGLFDVMISASNASGSDSRNVQFQILPSIGAPSTPLVEIVAPTSGELFGGDRRQITIRAEITPQPGEEIETAYVRWMNRPAGFGGISDTVANLDRVGANPLTGADIYEGTVLVGFNPANREVGGGAIDLRVVAFQTNAESTLDQGIDDVSLRIGPLIEFTFPDAFSVMDRIRAGDVFAGIKVNTNDFAEASARISGQGTLELVTEAVLPANGVINFESTTGIDFPGTYTLRLKARDNFGLETVIEREISLSDTIANPQAVITSPSPSFSNEVFTPATLSFFLVDIDVVEDEGVVVGYNYTYRFDVVSGGQGYFPREGQRGITVSTDTGFILTFPGANFANGRLIDISSDITFFWPLGDPTPGDQGTAVVDNPSNPGRLGMVLISAEFFRSDAPLQSYRLFVNGEDLTPGTGNLNLAFGPIDVPSIFYRDGDGAPAPGDYVVVAQVTDVDGNVGTSQPLSFRILPFEPLTVELSRVGIGPILQGQSVTYLIDVEPFDDIVSVEIIDSATDEEIGIANPAVVDGRQLFRFTRQFNQFGNFTFFARATTTQGQSGRSRAETLNVIRVNDVAVDIILPVESEVEFRPGGSLTFEATASATPGIEVVEWLRDGQVVSSVSNAPYRYTASFPSQGTFRFSARARDNLGNVIEGSREVVVQVRIPSPVSTPFWGVLEPRSNGFDSQALGRLAFPSNPQTDTWAYSISLDDWIGYISEGLYWSRDLGFIRTFPNNPWIVSSRFEWVFVPRDRLSGQDPWFFSAIYGWVARSPGDNSGRIFYSVLLNGFLEVLSNDRIRSFDFGPIQATETAPGVSASLGFLNSQRFGSLFFPDSTATPRFFFSFFANEWFQYLPSNRWWNPRIGFLDEWQPVGTSLPSGGSNPYQWRNR